MLLANKNDINDIMYMQHASKSGLGLTYLTILDFIQGNTMQLYEKYKKVMEVVAIKSDWPRSLYVSKTLIAYSGNDLFKYLYMF